MKRAFLLGALGVFLLAAFASALRDRHPRAALRLANVAKLKRGLNFTEVSRRLDREVPVEVVGYVEEGREVSYLPLSADRHLKTWWNAPTKGSGGLIVLDRWEPQEGAAPRGDSRWWRMGF